MLGRGRYLEGFAALCALLGVFGAVMLLGGLREASVGRVATTVLLLAVSVALWVVSRVRSHPKPPSDVS